ncbi:hypothetical protein AMTRI_Chr01g128240 [Amborella trichopoda]
MASPNEYLMRVVIGTPTERYYLIADTRSDLTWIQFLPCSNFFKQKAPIFDRKSSSTYRSLNCSSTLCQNLGKTSTGATFSTDRGTGAKINGLGFGCGSSNGGFGADGKAGLIGLGGGPLSLISQLGSSISNKFSYCLASRLDRNATGVTAIIKFEQTPTFYFLNLSDISVGKKRLGIPPGTFDPNPFSSEYGDGSATSRKLLTETFTFETPRSTLTSLSASISANPTSSLTTTRSTDPIKTSSSATFSTYLDIGAKIKGLRFGCGASNISGCGSSNISGFRRNGEAGPDGLGGDISVEKKRLGIRPGRFDLTKIADGGFLIDSGTTLTLLPTRVSRLGHAPLSFREREI